MPSSCNRCRHCPVIDQCETPGSPATELCLRDIVEGSSLPNFDHEVLLMGLDLEYFKIPQGEL